MRVVVRSSLSGHRHHHMRTVRRCFAAGFLLLAAGRGSATGRTVEAQTVRATNSLVGAWRVNVTRSHYGRGAEARVRETFTCRALVSARGDGGSEGGGGGGDIACTIRSVRAGGGRRELTGQFTVALDGAPRPVTGMPGMDAVALTPVAGVGRVIDATFSARGTPVYAYRVYGAGDGRTLTLVAVDPVTRAVLTSIVVYDRVTP